jgi:hypothetical protein
MAAMSDYLEVELRKHIFRTGTFTKPSDLYVALYTAAPSDSGGGTEVTGGSYARVSVAPDDANWSGASSTNGLTGNVSAITFPAPTGNWGSVTHFGIFDAATGGNLLFHGALTVAKTINNGDSAPSFAAGDLTITFA